RQPGPHHPNLRHHHHPPIPSRPHPRRHRPCPHQATSPIHHRTPPPPNPHPPSIHPTRHTPKTLEPIRPNPRTPHTQHPNTHHGSPQPDTPQLIRRSDQGLDSPFRAERPFRSLGFLCGSGIFCVESRGTQRSLPITRRGADS